jgi:uncharacterized protein with ParB-like and HNH nuclease domain
MPLEDDKAIEVDSDPRLKGEYEGTGSIYPYNPEYENIEIGEDPFSVFEYIRQLSRNRINIAPDFQRNHVWKPIQKSGFIESVLLNFPLPPIYLNETKDSTYIVIDGLQRSITLYDFYTNKFPLNDLKALPKYNGLYYKDLTEQMQSKFENKKLTTFILKPSTPLAIIYDLFNRINTGGTQLNRQEVRNCIFIGKSTELLKYLASRSYFREAIGNGVSSTRMKDREVVLRYIAFRWFDYKKEYMGDMSDYIESAMKRINSFDDAKIDEIKKDFQRVFELSYKIWGKKNFRIPTPSNKGFINTAILETVCNYLSSKNDAYVQKNNDRIKERYTELISHPDFVDSITTATGNKAKVMKRFQLVYDIFDRR